MLEAVKLINQDTQKPVNENHPQQEVNPQNPVEPHSADKLPPPPKEVFYMIDKKIYDATTPDAVVTVLNEASKQYLLPDKLLAVAQEAIMALYSREEGKLRRESFKFTILSRIVNSRNPILKRLAHGLEAKLRQEMVQKGWSQESVQELVSKPGHADRYEKVQAEKTQLTLAGLELKSKLVNFVTRVPNEKAIQVIFQQYKYLMQNAVKAAPEQTSRIYQVSNRLLMRQLSEYGPIQTAFEQFDQKVADMNFIPNSPNRLRAQEQKDLALEGLIHELDMIALKS